MLNMKPGDKGAPQGTMISAKEFTS